MAADQSRSPLPAQPRVHALPTDRNPHPQARRRQPAALSDADRATILAVLSAEENLDLSVVQTYWRSFDAGGGGVQRAFYRDAAAANLVGDRRRRRGVGSVPARTRPVAEAGAVGQCGPGVSPNCADRAPRIGTCCIW